GACGIEAERSETKGSMRFSMMFYFLRSAESQFLRWANEVSKVGILRCGLLFHVQGYLSVPKLAFEHNPLQHAWRRPLTGKRRWQSILAFGLFQIWSAPLTDFSSARPQLLPHWDSLEAIAWICEVSRKTQPQPTPRA